MTVSGEEKEKGRRGGFPLLPCDLAVDLWAAPSWGGPLSTSPYAFSSVVIGMTCTYLRPSLPSRNATVPSVSAKSVWSLPMPTLLPACHFVPRWRTMMFPARAALAAEQLHAEALALTVATVAAGTACFFMCHDELLPNS